MKLPENILKLDWKQLVLFWEVTDFCNARCIMCGAHSVLKYPHGFRSGFTTLKEFSIMIKNLKNSEIKPSAIVYSWLGESLLNPFFPEMLEMAEAAGFTNQQFNTNGLLLRPPIVDRLLKLKSLKRIHLSLDASDEVTWEKIKRIKGFSIVVDNIEYLLRKISTISNPPDVIMAFIVQEANYKRAKLFLKFASELFEKYSLPFIVAHDVVRTHGVNVILFSRLITSNQAKANLLHKKVVKKLGIFDQAKEDITPAIKTQQITVLNRFKKSFKKIENKKRLPCAALWYMPNIDYKGNLTICCHDIFLKYKLGNLKFNTFSELWFGEKIQKYRRWHLQGEFYKMELCNLCGNIEHFVLEFKK